MIRCTIITNITYCSYFCFEQVWIGYNDIFSEGHFVGTDGRPPRFTHWDIDEPNNYKGQEDCVVMWKSPRGDNGAWNDDQCDIRWPFICEIKS